MEILIGETRFDQFTLEQKVVLILNNFEPVNAIVTGMGPWLDNENAILILVPSTTFQIHDKFWNHPNGIRIREEEGSIQSNLPTQEFDNQIVILTYNPTNGQYVSTNSEIFGGIKSIIFPISRGMSTGGGKSRKYYKKLSKKYRKNRKTRKLRKKKIKKEENKYSK